MNNGSGLDNINRGIDALIRQYSPEQLRRFDTNSWLELYGKIDNLIFPTKSAPLVPNRKAKESYADCLSAKTSLLFATFMSMRLSLRKSLPKSPNSPVKPPETLNKKSPSFSIR